MKLFTLMAGLIGAAVIVTAPNSRASDAGPVLAELFTSQSCSSCPPAEELFAELADDPDLVTLEWHVDYWDDLVYGQYGAWKDPYSDPAFTERQRRYNHVLRNTRSVYTPQAVIGGASETTGSQEKSIRELIENSSTAKARLVFKQTLAGTHVVASTEQPAELWVATYIEDAHNDVPRGENHGRALGGRHVVQGVTTLAQLDAGKAREALPSLEEGMGCAVILQAPDLGPVYAAAYCP